MNGLLSQFFTNIIGAKFETGHSCRHSKFVNIQVPLFAAKTTIDLMLHQIRSQIVTISNVMADYTPVNTQADTPKKEFKLLTADKNLTEILGFESNAASIDELESYIQTLTDLQEQLWAKTRSDQCLPEIKSIFTNISRPYSALNRLGSFVNWPFSRHAKLCDKSQTDSNGPSCSIVDMSPFKLCDNGLFLKAND